MTPVEVDDAVLAEMPLPDHGDTATKHERGVVLVIGGGRETPGAALLAGVAALRVGAGKLQIVISESAAPALAAAIPEARVIGVPETDRGELAAAAAPIVAERAAGASAVLIGPGVLDRSGLEAIVPAVLDATDGSVVLDASAVSTLRRRDARRPNVLAVPNPGELAELGFDDALAAARELDVVVACRDAETVIATPDGRAWIDRSGSVTLATSGSGDVASGAVAGLAARGASRETAAVWGARVHGVAGERLAARVGPLGVLARDLLDELPRVLTDLQANMRR